MLSFSASLSAKKLKLLLNDSGSKKNDDNVDVTGWMLTSYVEQNKINKTDNNAASQTISRQLMAAKMLLLINQVFMNKRIFLIVYY